MNFKIVFSSFDLVSGRWFLDMRRSCFESWCLVRAGLLVDVCTGLWDSGRWSQEEIESSFQGQLLWDWWLVVRQDFLSGTKQVELLWTKITCRLLENVRPCPRCWLSTLLSVHTSTGTERRPVSHNSKYWLFWWVIASFFFSYYIIYNLFPQMSWLE